MATEKQTNGYVKWQVFAWVVSIGTISILATFAQSNSIASVANENKVDIKVLQSQYSTIIESLAEIKAEIRR